MKSGIKALLLGIKLAFAENMAYRSSFFLSMSIMFIFEFFYPIVSIIIYSSGSSFPGWNLYQVLLVQGAFIFAKGIAFPLFVGLFFRVSWQVRMGTLDIMMLRPRPVLFTVIITSFNIHDMSKILTGLLIIIFAVCHLPAAGFLQWLSFSFLILLSIALIFSFVVLMAVYTIRFIGSNTVLDLIDPVTQYGLYPRSIYSEPIKTIITNIFPVAMIGFYPASVLMGKDLTGLLPAIICSILFIVASLVLWSKSIAKYTSAGG